MGKVGIDLLVKMLDKEMSKIGYSRLMYDFTQNYYDVTYHYKRDNCSSYTVDVQLFHTIDKRPRLNEDGLYVKISSYSMVKNELINKEVKVSSPIKEEIKILSNIIHGYTMCLDNVLDEVLKMFSFKTSGDE